MAESKYSKSNVFSLKRERETANLLASSKQLLFLFYQRLQFSVFCELLCLILLLLKSENNHKQQEYLWFICFYRVFTLPWFLYSEFQMISCLKGYNNRHFQCSCAGHETRPVPSPFCALHCIMGKYDTDPSLGSEKSVDLWPGWVYELQLIHLVILCELDAIRRESNTQTDRKLSS